MMLPSEMGGNLIQTIGDFKLVVVDRTLSHRIEFESQQISSISLSVLWELLRN